MQNINQCPTVFCNCQTIPIPFRNGNIYANTDTNTNSHNIMESISWLINFVINPTATANANEVGSQKSSTYKQDDDDSNIQIPYKLYMYIICVVIFIMFSIQLSMRWFIYKDYYPLKQKSPTLTILMIFSICTQVILYPLIYIINYFTYMFIDPNIRNVFRAVQVGLQFSVYSIYLLRCLRIAYAHNVDKSRRKTFSFRIFQRQWVLASIVMLVVILRLCSVIFEPCTENCNDFAFGFQIAAFNDSYDLQMIFVIRSLIIGFIWQLILMYCILLHKNVNYRYSMSKQISLVLAATQVTNILHILTLAQTLTQNSTMHYLCEISRIYPMTQFLRLVNLLIAFGISAIYPLTKKKVYHQLLPTGPHYGFVKTMRNFLIQKQFLRVFSKFLQHLDSVQQTQYYTKLLKTWQETLLLRFQSKLKPEKQKLSSIITLVQSIQNQNMFHQHSQLISTLKGTINGLQDSFLQNGEQNQDNISESGQINVQNQANRSGRNNPNRLSKSKNTEQLAQQIQDLQSRTHQIQRQLLQKRRQKYRQSINDKIDQLQQIALQKLNKIYVQKYYLTQSYIYLKQIMNQYKKVNLNLIMLNMALIVDDQNQFN